MITIHVPLHDFEFIEFQFDGTVEEALVESKRLWEVYRGKEGLPTGEFHKTLDGYLNTGEMVGGSELYSRMSLAQQSIFQELKKAFKRINYKLSK